MDVLIGLLNSAIVFFYTYFPVILLVAVLGALAYMSREGSRQSASTRAFDRAYEKAYVLGRACAARHLLSSNRADGNAAASVQGTIDFGFGDDVSGGPLFDDSIFDNSVNNDDMFVGCDDTFGSGYIGGMGDAAAFDDAIGCDD